MFALRPRRVLVIGVAIIMLLSAAAAVTAFSRSNDAPNAIATVTSTHVAEPPPSAPAGHLSALPNPAVGNDREQQVLQALHRDGVSAKNIRLPDLSVPRPYPGQLVEPTYASAPAPMGVADLGLENTSGTITRSVLNSSSVEGTINLTNAEAVYLDGVGPASFGIQLNAVDHGVTVFGNDTYQYWVQNFAGYNPVNGSLELGDEVWNWSTYVGNFPANGIYSNGPNGSFIPGVLYQGFGPTFTIHYPFTLTLYENATVLQDRPAIYLNYTLSNGTMRTSATYDFLVFNSTAGTPTSPAPSGEFQINGYELSPGGPPSDLELDVVGNGGGDTTTFNQMNATLSIATWNSSLGVFQPAPSALNFGSETGETSDGVAVYWNGVSPVAQMTLGPSFLEGLWNLSSDSGARAVVQTLNPAPTFIFVNPGSTLNESEGQWVVSSPSGTTTFSIPNGGDYWLEYLLADRVPGGLAVTGAANSTTTTSFTSAVDMALGVYTPLIAFGNGELAALSSGGTGSAARPYVLLNNEYGALDPEFAPMNDWQFPVFPGLLLVGTTANVLVTPPSFQIDYPSWVLPELTCTDLPPPYTNCPGLPTTNNLQIQFWETSHVRVLDGKISGWLSANVAGDGAVVGELMFWNCTDNIVAGNTFLDQGTGIFLYGGSGNTIWGNTFFSAVVGATNPATVLNYGPLNEGVNESESGDLIYNNYFDVGVPALTATLDPVSCNWFCEPASYSDTWNVSLEPASASQVILGVTLTGSIIGTWYQGGNYWSNYGSGANPYGVLPYNDSGGISSGGDYVPLVPFTLYNVTFSETGLPAGATWGVSALVNTTSTLSTLNLSAPNGTYEYTVESPPGYTTGAGNFTVNGSAIQVDISFVRTVNLTLNESGLPSGVVWSLQLNGSELGSGTLYSAAVAPGSIVLALGAGVYLYNASAPDYAATPNPGEVAVGTVPSQVTLIFTSTINGTLTGVIVPAVAALWVGGTSEPVGMGGTFSVTLPIGIQSLKIAASGYLTYFNNVTVANGTTSLGTITLTATPAGPSYSAYGISAVGWVLIGFLAFLAALFLVMTLIFAGRRRLPPGQMIPYVAPPAAPSADAAPTAGPSRPAPAPAPPPEPPIDLPPPPPAEPPMETPPPPGSETSEASAEPSALSAPDAP